MLIRSHAIENIKNKVRINCNTVDLNRRLLKLPTFTLTVASNDAVSVTSFRYTSTASNVILDHHPATLCHELAIYHNLS